MDFRRYLLSVVVKNVYRRSIVSVRRDDECGLEGPYRAGISHVSLWYQGVSVHKAGLVFIGGKTPGLRTQLSKQFRTQSNKSEAVESEKFEYIPPYSDASSGISFVISQNGVDDGARYAFVSAIAHRSEVIDELSNELC